MVENEDDKLNGDEEREALYLDKAEEIEIRKRHELTGDIIPIIELLVCSKCINCKAFEEVLLNFEIGDIIAIDSMRGRRKMQKYGLTETDHPILIANGEVQFVGKTLTEDEFKDWFFLKYGYRLLP